MKTIRLRNKSPLEKYILEHGTKITLGAFAEQVFDISIAQKFLSKHSQDVEKIDDEDFGAIAQPLQNTGLVWLANVTGNPDVPDMLQVKERLPKGWATKGSPYFEADVKNPAKDPKTLKWTIGGSQVEYTNAGGGLSAYNMPGRVISIPPFRRVEVTKYIADWLLNREGGSMLPGIIGTYPIKVIVSRPPSKFEPSLQWPLDELNEYLKLVDSEAPMEPKEAVIRKCNKKRSESEIMTEIDTVKRKVMKRIYFRLVDPSYILPTEEEWTEYFEKLIAPVTEEKEIANSNIDGIE